ncbi:MAG: HEAT repeat domain-containing protein [Deltaproteobacteria bacterium]|nr:HEAT repeat domain-containing protein [Deltaproteobacteria bacterium]
MGSRLSSLLVRDGLLSVSRLQEAFTLQVVRGGALDTVLLEEQLATEPTLLELLSRLLGHPPLPPELLAPDATPPAPAPIPLAQAQSHGLCALKQEGSRVWVLTTEATDHVALEELAYELGLELVPYAATELRCVQAQHLAYGTPLSPRYARLLERLGERPGAAVTASPPERAPVNAPTALEALPTEESAPPDLGRESGDAQAIARVRLATAPPERSSTPPARTRRPKSSAGVLEPLELPLAIGAMELASDRDQVLLALLRGAHLFLHTVHLYVVQGETLVGRFALEGHELDAQAIREQRVSLEGPSVLGRCVRDGTLFVGPAPATDASADVLASLHLPASGIVVGPVRIKRKSVCVLMGHHFGAVPPPHTRAAIAQLLDEAAVALARLIVQGRPPPAVATPVSPPEPEPEGETFELSAELPTDTPAPRGFASGELFEVSGEIVVPLDRSRREAVVTRSARITTPVPPATPKVIVNLDEEPGPGNLDRLLLELEAGGTRADAAREAIAELGRPAVEALVSRLPAAVTANANADAGEVPPEAECGALLRALALLGRPVVASVAPLLRHKERVVRLFACHLLGELAYPESVALLASARHDDDESVRQVAGRALRRFRELAELPRLLEELLADLTNPEVRPRQAAMDALAALGDSQVVPLVISQLADSDPRVVSSARSALVALTKQDHGQSLPDWQEWWSQNQDRHRVEWLIDGLIHSSPEIRAAAAAELQELTGVSFGFHDHLSRAEREEIRRRYLVWWGDAGLLDFGRFG